MSEGQPIRRPRDYADAAVTARYGYYASVLRPGLSRDQVQERIAELQDWVPPPGQGRFVARLTPAEVNDFYDRYEIVTSSHQDPSIASTGLDAVVLRSRTTNALFVSIGGVGPFNLNTVTVH